jgi:tetratricopeptide (TPR) repeat protein
MFKINIYLKLALTIVSLVLGIWLWAAFGTWYGIWFVIIGVVLLVSYIMLGTIVSASEMVQKQDFDAAEKRLSLTLSPKLLYPTNRAYYYILKGSFAVNKKDQKQGEELFNKALSIKLPSDNEKAMILLQLANINASKSKWTTAKKYYNDAKKLKITEKTLKDQLKEFNKVFANKGAMRQAGAMGRDGMSMMRGGKRRRPKMR